MTEKTKRIARDAFFSRLRMFFMDYLQRNFGIFKDWGFIELLDLVDAIITSKRAEIEVFLDNSNYTLKDADSVMKYVTGEFLVPEIEKIKL